MNRKTAIVFGATGLTGNYLLNLLLNDSRYEKVKVFVRREINFPANEKLEVNIVELASPEKYSQLLAGNDLFCCLGTTIAVAGSKEAFRKIDFELPVKIAEAASKNKISSFIVVSSLGADSKNSNFYLKTKGEMEEAIQKFPFRKFSSLRPSMLLGYRKEFRLGELIGKVLMKALGFIFTGSLKKYKAIHAEDVAKAMIAIANNDFAEKTFESNRIQDIADSFNNI